jgi:hypothetical protein
MLAHVYIRNQRTHVRKRSEYDISELELVERLLLAALLGFIIWQPPLRIGSRACCGWV